MPKRFTDTEKWKKPFLRNLKAPYKLLWFYILDECDHAGIWQVDFEVAQIKIGEKLNLNDAIKQLSHKIVILDGGEKWFLPSFIEFQYGVLAENNRAHTKVILLLSRYNLIDENLKIKGVTSPFQVAKEEEKEKEVDKDKEKEEEQVIYPFQSENFINIWGEWIKYKKKQHQFTYKSDKYEQAALKELSELSGGIENTAIRIIQKSIANGYKGLFKIDDNGTTKAQSNGASLQGAFDKVDAMYRNDRKGDG